MYENFVGTLETVRNREVSVLERCPHGEVRLRFYHAPRDPDVTTFGDWLNRYGGQNKRKQSSRAVSNTKA